MHGKAGGKAVNSPGLAGSSSASVHCRAIKTHTSWPFVLVSVGMGCFSEGGVCTSFRYTAGAKFICEVHKIPFPPLSKTVIVGQNSTGRAEPAARPVDLHDFFSSCP